MKYKLLSVDHDAKTIKGRSVGALTGILYLAPHTLAQDSLHNLTKNVDTTSVPWYNTDKMNDQTNNAATSTTSRPSSKSFPSVCPHSTPGCRASCLFTAGQAIVFKSINAARIKKTLAFQADPSAFLAILASDIEKLQRQAADEGLVPCVRLNGTSDIRWERLTLDSGETLHSTFPDVWFYDYTKWPLSSRSPSFNYRLTYSVSERRSSWTEASRYLLAGQNAAVVFRTPALVTEACSSGIVIPTVPASRLSSTMPNATPVVNGDEHDARALDTGVIVALKAKGKARSDTSGFVLDSVPGHDIDVTPVLPKRGRSLAPSPAVNGSHQTSEVQP